MDVIEKIKSQMQLRGWSEYRLAKESGLSQSTISNIFRRNTLPSIPTLKIICDAFGISLSQFFLEDENYNTLLSSKQEKLLNKWGKLSAPQQTALMNLINEIIK